MRLYGLARAVFLTVLLSLSKHVVLSKSTVSTSGTKPTARYHYVLSVHSSKALMVEEFDTKQPKYQSALADAVLQLAVAKGKQEGVINSVGNQ